MKFTQSFTTIPPIKKYKVVIRYPVYTGYRSTSFSIDKLPGDISNNKGNNQAFF
jgi:hypothetical protein